MQPRCLIIIMLLFCIYNVQAEQCSAIFGDAAQSNNNNGKIIFYGNGKLVNNPDNIIPTPAMDDYSRGLSCQTANCVASGTPSASARHDSFPNNGHNWIAYNNSGNFSISPSDGYDNIVVNNSNVVLTVLPGDYNSLTINGNDAIVELLAGDYTFSGNLTLNNNSIMRMSVSGVVRIFVQNTIALNGGSIDVVGEARQLLLYSKQNINFYSNSSFKGFAYSESTIAVQGNVTGAVSGNYVYINNKTITFENTVPDFGDFCEGGTPTIPMSCTASLPAIAFSDNFSSVNNGWQTTDFTRTISNWPGDSIVNSSRENKDVDFSISGNKLSIDGANEYGMVGIDLSREGIDKTSVDKYALSVDVTANKSGNNNDIGLVFGYIDDSNYHLARWTKYGTSYKNNSNYPGIYRRLELVKVASGTATTMVSLDNFNPSDPFNLKVVVNDQGSLVCVDNNELLYSATEQPILNDIGLYSYDNDRGVSLDNIEVRCDDCSGETLIAHYAMDEVSWSGAGGEVIDETGNYNAQAKNGADTDNANPAIAGNPGTCGYGTFDGVNSYISLPSSFENKQGSFTITAWINPSNLESGSRIFIDDANNSGGYGFSLSDDDFGDVDLNSGQLRFFSRDVNPTSIDTLNNVVSINTWIFVSAVHDAVHKTRQIYINGVAQQLTTGGTSSTYSGNWGIDNGLASIGGEIGSLEADKKFTGNIDEVRIYDGALSSSEINAIYTETHPCAIYLDHYQINHDGQGLTCDAETITIKACADESCSTLNHDATDVQLSINGVVDQTVTVSGGSTDANFSYTNVGTATLSLDQAYACKNGGSASCDIVFADAGFRFLYDAAESTTIENQTSGTNFPETLKLQAVKNVNGVCTGIFNGNKRVQLSQQNIDPGDSTGLSFNVDGSPIDKYPTFTSDIRLNFGGDSKATIPTPVYLDAGQIRLQAKYDDNSVSLVGSSNDFWVSPFKLVASANVGGSNINGNTSTALITHTAGQPFDFTVTAYNSLGTAAENITANYEPNDIEFLLTRTGPTGGGVNDNFNYGNGSILSSLEPTYQDVTLTAFSAGISSTNSASYSEVGLLNLELQDVDYGYLGNVINGGAIDIGRFTPAYFIQSVESHGNLVANHSSLCTDKNWVYAGQTGKDGGTIVGSISYDVDIPTIKITAYNNDGEITENYTEEGFNKLLATGIDISLPLTDDEKIRTTQTPAVPDDKVKISAVMSDGDDPEPSGENGILTYEFSDTDHFVYEHNKFSKLSPFSAQIPFEIVKIEDTDLVNLYSGTDTLIEPTEKVVSEGVEVRFGRWRIENSFAPETSNLPMPMYIEQYNGISFITNPQESCILAVVNNKKTSGVIGSGDLDLWDYRLVDLNTGDSLLPSHTGASVTFDTSFETGIYREFVFSAPMQDRQGSLEIEYQVPSWLQYDWAYDDEGVDDSFNDNPTATATFGIFRGNDRIIYQREVH
ncbi:MAG: LamG domain-containing protein [Colwellia sp.]